MMFTPTLIGATILLSGIASALPAPLPGHSGDKSSSSSSDSSYSSSNSGYSGSSNSGYDSSSSSSNYGYSGSSNSGYSGSGSDNSGYSGSNSGYSGSSSGYSGSSSGYSGSNSGYSGSNSGYSGSNSGYSGSYSSDVTTDLASSTVASYESIATSSSSSYVVSYEASSTIDYSTSAALETSTYSVPSYGSGSSSWNSGYDDCVQSCIASFGGMATASYEAPTATMGYTGSGNGATHTVIVAPTQGVLRFVPFALNASVGDTVMFMWNANNHTVTKSSELTPCNKSQEAPVFASGENNKGFVFNQVINDTSTTFYYCGTPGHCEKGMFGIINPPNALVGANTSVGSMMDVVASTSSDVQAYASYTNQNTAGSAAASWGASIDMANIPSWAQADYLENVLFTRNFIAANPEVWNSATNAIDLSSMATTPLMIPDDVAAALASSDASASGGAATVSAATSATVAGAAESTSTSPSANGAGSLVSSKLFVAAATLAATFFLL